MQTKEYSGYIDKSEWGDGEWQSEPDKVQWRDEVTGLPCLIVRGPMGALCGYVGVPNAHPLHGKDYDDCTINCDRGDSRWCDHTPEHILSAHGGINFAHGCTEIDKEKWQNVRAAMPKWREEAAKYPKGDSAQRIKELTPIIDDYDKWRERQVAISICHIPAPGEPDDVWWFGFDCAHSGDVSPGMSREYRMNIPGDTYRNVAYVREECRSLAEQLAKNAASK